MCYTIFQNSYRFLLWCVCICTYIYLVESLMSYESCPMGFVQNEFRARDVYIGSLRWISGAGQVFKFGLDLTSGASISDQSQPPKYTSNCEIFKCLHGHRMYVFQADHGPEISKYLLSHTYCLGIPKYYTISYCRLTKNDIQEQFRYDSRTSSRCIQAFSH